MASSVVKSIKPSGTSQTSHTNSIQTISGRQSKELVIAFCGAIGAGIKSTKKAAQEELEELGYDVVDLRLSQLMDQFLAKDANYLMKLAIVRMTMLLTVMLNIKT